MKSNRGEGGGKGDGKGGIARRRCPEKVESKNDVGDKPYTPRGNWKRESYEGKERVDWAREMEGKRKISKSMRRRKDGCP